MDNPIFWLDAYGYRWYVNRMRWVANPMSPVTYTCNIGTNTPPVEFFTFKLLFYRLKNNKYRVKPLFGRYIGVEDTIRQLNKIFRAVPAHKDLAIVEIQARIQLSLLGFDCSELRND